MAECCETSALELANLRGRQGRVLKLVLGVNLVMFCAEFGAGWLARSTALLGDSLDMLGDALVYGFTLYVLQRGPHWRARAALLKGAIMAVFGGAVLFQAIVQIQAGAPPEARVMAGIGTLALLANALCFGLLFRHRADDLNLRSTWLCSRNDLLANGAVLAAAALVAGSGSPWPDIAVGVGIAALFLRTAGSVIRESLGELAHESRSYADLRGRSGFPRS